MIYFILMIQAVSLSQIKWAVENANMNKDLQYILNVIMTNDNTFYESGVRSTFKTLKPITHNNRIMF